MTISVPVSTVPAAIAYLASAIQTQLATDSSPITVVIGEQATDIIDQDAVQIGEVRRLPDPMAMVGSGGQFFLEEKYDIEILVSSFTGSTDDDGTIANSLALTARAWQLAAYVETASRLDPSMGELVQRSYPSASASVGPENRSNGRVCEVALSVHVEATL